jgi:hypothetical protein
VHELVVMDDEATASSRSERRKKDARYGVLPRLGDRTVLEEIVHYCGEEEPDPKNRVCTWSRLDAFLRSMLELPASEVLEVCRMNDEPSLYESLVTMLSAKTLTENAYRSEMGKMSKKAKKPSSARRLRALKSLATFSPRSDGEHTIPARCNLRACKYHSSPP